MDYRGQQIFIIHPDAPLRDRLVRFLRHAEFEAYGVAETDSGLLASRRDSVVFLYAGERRGWDASSLAAFLSEQDIPVRISALGVESPPRGFEEAFDGAASDLEQSLPAYLGEIGARGHRHFVRFGTQHSSIATFAFQIGERHYAGVIHDISTRGMSCTFKPEPDIPGHLEVENMQLNLPGSKREFPGRFTLKRVVAGQIIRIFQFSRDLPPEARDGIYDFIYTSLEMKLSGR